ncbi:pre-mRNA-processing factor 39-like isoform X2 [Brienomyrus brachyistius]|uniref:pre-mRNA-processing factor 39-like isoform X2 n=1 Tax=Brienomyrus brachyistius TaxID=42636 RepID=UPI0020B20612|nr:pre-mRNA-processing factor 39-like isoform X2 [Brienomyrus brachyistius]
MHEDTVMVIQGLWHFPPPDKPPLEETLTSMLNFDPSCSSLDLADGFPTDPPTQDPLWIESLQMASDPFVVTISTIPDDEPSLLQAELLCTDGIKMPQSPKLDQVGQLERLDLGHVEGLEILGLDQVEQLVTLEPIAEEPLELSEQPGSMQQSQEDVQPGSGQLQPGSGQLQPGSGQLQPGSGQLQPSQEGVQPSQEGVQLGSGQLQPSQEGVQPSQEGVQPGSGQLQPVPPSQEGVQPGSGQLQPGSGQLQPGSGQLQPSQEGVQPGSGQLQLVQPSRGDEYLGSMQPSHTEEQPEALECGHMEKFASRGQEAIMSAESSGCGPHLTTGSVPGSPTNMELEDSSKVVMSEEVPFPEESERFFRAVEENPEDFNGWTYLLQHVEEEDHIGAARKAFDSFFSQYPFCYGYWKKYADMEKRLSGIQMADEVYRRGLQAIPVSVDLWLQYADFVREVADGAEAESRVRLVFEHAVLSAGLDFRSDRLWEAYIAWETGMGNLTAVTALYDRILAIPTQLYSQHHQRFKEHVQNNLPKHFLSLEEFSKLRKELASVDKLSGEEVSPSEDLPLGTEDLADPAKRVTEIENMRHRVLELRHEIFNHNENEVSKRWTFEDGIKRPYFHVKPLERAQLAIWREYLDFEMENGSLERVVMLFERCLVACAFYEEFWIKYARFMMNYSIDGARDVYTKACLTHLPKKPSIHLLWAMFEEQQEARRILKALEDVQPHLAVVRLRHVNLERRQGNMEEAESLLQDAIQNGKTPSEATFYSLKLARLFFKTQRNLLKARNVLLDAIEVDEMSPKLYLNLLELEYSGDVQENEDQIVACFDRALRSPLPLESRLTFSQRKMEFLEDFGSDINMLMSSYEEHQKLLKMHESSKRETENDLACTGFTLQFPGARGKETVHRRREYELQPRECGYAGEPSFIQLQLVSELQLPELVALWPVLHPSTNVMCQLFGFWGGGGRHELMCFSFSIFPVHMTLQ